MKPKRGSFDFSHLSASETGKESDVRQRPRLTFELISSVDIGHIHTLKASLQLQGFKPVTAPPQLKSRMQFKIKIGLKLYLVRIGT